MAYFITITQLAFLSSAIYGNIASFALESPPLHLNVSARHTQVSYRIFVLFPLGRITAIPVTGHLANRQLANGPKWTTRQSTRTNRQYSQNN